MQNIEGGKTKNGAHCWSEIRIDGGMLVDEHGRSVLLRGVNLTGNSKIPMSTPVPGTPPFFDHRTVSFIGRPFLLTDIHEHFERLSNWGLTFARLLVPWEALEHAGPGIYDEAYIDSLIAVLGVAESYGIKCFVGF